jgi:hypothetical protein
MWHGALLPSRTIRGIATLVEAILLTGLYSARNSFVSVDSPRNACGPPGFVGSA